MTRTDADNIIAAFATAGVALTNQRFFKTNPDIAAIADTHYNLAVATIALEITLED